MRISPSSAENRLWNGTDTKWLTSHFSDAFYMDEYRRLQIQGVDRAAALKRLHESLHGGEQLPQDQEAELFLLYNYLKYQLAEALKLVEKNPAGGNVARLKGDIFQLGDAVREFADQLATYIWRTYTPVMEAFLQKGGRRMLASTRVELDDIFQDAFLKFRQYVVPAYDFRQATLRSYAVSTVKNRLMDLYRKETRRGFLKLQSELSRPGDEAWASNEFVQAVAGPGSDPSNVAQTRENQRIITETLPSLLDILPGDSRETMQLLLLELRYEDIAEIQDIPLGTVKSRISKSRERLDEALSDHDQFRALASIIEHVVQKNSGR